MRATLLALSLLGCDTGGGSETSSATTRADVSQSPSERAASSSPSSPGTTSASVEGISASLWFVGRWSGDYTVEKHRVERPSVQIAWMRDDGSRFAGRGTLNFDVDAHGRLLGSGEGALGGQRIVGFLDAEALTFRLEGTPTVDAMSGVVSCGKVASGSEAACSVNATSGDGNFRASGKRPFEASSPRLAVNIDLEHNFRSIRGRIEAACERAQRASSSVRLLAVSKTKPSADIERAYALGMRDFGENYVQELVVKRAALEHLTEARWHLIGHLQSNKVAKAVAVAHVIQTIDSIKRAQEIDRRALAADLTVEGFIEVNVAEEPQKAGARPGALADLVAALREMGNLKLLGLMAIPPESSNAEASRPHFRRLRELARGFELARLSMGMSHDFEIAIEEGATDVRVGSALFGARVRP